MNSTPTLPQGYNPELYIPFESLQKISFSTNWNGKLRNKIYTTLRLRPFTIGTIYAIVEKGTFIHRARCIKVVELKLDQLTDYIAYLDTGYNAAQTREIIITMYKSYNIDWTKKSIYVSFMENIEY